MQVLKAQLGKKIPLVLRVREVRNDSQDGRLYTPRGVVLAHVKNPAGTAIVSNASPVMRREGEYVYHWDTAGLTAGLYEARFDVMVNNSGDVASRAVIVQLVKQGAS